MAWSGLYAFKRDMSNTADGQRFFVGTTYTHQPHGREREPRIKTQRQVKLAAKLLTIAWPLMKKKEPFNPDYLKVEIKPL